MTWARWLSLLAVLLCSGATVSCRGRSTRAELADLERRYQEDAVRIDGVALDLSRLTITQRQVVATYAAATREWEVAQSLYAEAASQQELAARGLKQAAADFQSAEHYYRLASAAMAAVAARTLGTIVCSETMSTRRFRKELHRQGITIDQLEDVDHIFPHSRRGIDHPLNYQVLDRSLNRSLGNKLVAKFMQAPLGFVRGMAVSALGVVGGCN